MIKTLLITLLSLTICYSQSFDWAFQMPRRVFSEKMVVAPSGNIYLTGSFENKVDFDPDTGVFELISTNVESGFVLKLNPAGKFIWAKQLGGNDDLMIWDMKQDNNGDIVLTGHFSGSVDFDPGSAHFIRTAVEDEDIFVTKLDTNGNFIWCKTIGGKNHQGVQNMALDQNNNIYLAGPFGDSADFDAGVNDSILYADNTKLDGFLLKLNSAGDFIWVRQWRTEKIADFKINALGTDAANAVYVGGRFSRDIDFDPGQDSLRMESPDAFGSFVLKLDDSGQLKWAKGFKGKENVIAIDLISDQAGNVYFTGFFRDTVDFDPGPSQFNLIAPYKYRQNTIPNAFLVKLNNAGTLEWAHQITEFYVHSIGVSLMQDVYGDLYLMGGFGDSADFDPGPGTFKLVVPGSDYIFIAKYGSSDGGFRSAIAFGGPVSHMYPKSFGTNLSGDIYSVGGFTNTVDFDPGNASFSLTAANNFFTAFVQKLYQPDFEISETTFLSNINVYPNPSVKGTVRVELANPYKTLSAFLRSANGKILSEKTFYNSSQFSIEIDQPKGIYFLEIQSEKGERAVVKIIK